MLCSCIGNLTSLRRLRHLNLRWIRPLEFDCQWFRQWADMRTLQLDYVEDIRNSSALINQPGLRLTRLSVRSCKGITDQVIQPSLGNEVGMQASKACGCWAISAVYWPGFSS